MPSRVEPITGQLTEENGQLVGTFDDCYKTITITLSTADKYLDKDINIIANVREGHLSVTESTPTIKQGMPTVCNVTLVPGKTIGAYVTMPTITYSIPGVQYQIDEAGWLGGTDLITAGSSTGTVTGYPFGVTRLTLVNGDNIQLTDSNGTWTWKADADGNTYIY